MKSTQSYIKIHGITVEDAGDFSFDHDTGSSDLLTELVPDLDSWGGIGWMELRDFEYNPGREIINFTLETKWAPPLEWLRNATLGSHYFENKLVTMTTLYSDETEVRGVAVMDGEVLQNKALLEFKSEFVDRHYNEAETDFHVNVLENTIWDSIDKFVRVCEQFYLEGGNKEND
tara:strand:+ start:106 stop:627 length:522 start_codon:yes stop_codon:yes gene_type:complete